MTDPKCEIQWFMDPAILAALTGALIGLLLRATANASGRYCRTKLRAKLLNSAPLDGESDPYFNREYARPSSKVTVGPARMSQPPSEWSKPSG